MHIGPTEKPLNAATAPATALRWLDRNAILIKSGLPQSHQDQFDACMTVLWELVLNGKS